VRIPGAPKHLKKESKRFWRDVIREYELEDSASLKTLEQACESLDRIREAQKSMFEAGGALYKTPTGFWKRHPGVDVERGARGQFLQAMKQLGLDIEPLQDGPGRPVGSMK